MVSHLLLNTISINILSTDRQWDRQANYLDISYLQNILINYCYVKWT